MTAHRAPSKLDDVILERKAKQKGAPPLKYKLFPTGTSGTLHWLDANIAETAIFLIDSLKTIDRQAGPRKLTRQDIQELVYQLFLFRVRDGRNGKTITEHHLGLLAAVLKAGNGFSSRLAKFIGLPGIEIDHYSKFLKAVDIVAARPKISVNKLASILGVQRATVRAWYKDKLFQARLRVKRPTPEDLEIQAGKQRINAELRAEFARGG
ncbi:MAG TPA: hypothetical protein VMH84_05785 [Xanthobacteraceae bacterium]|nr:hypothetical protein [Xanthobacteraceae bacterium]